MKRGVDLRAVAAAAGVVAMVACTSGEAPPSTGSYTVEFPSTAAAVATDTVQVLVFDVPASQQAHFCEDLIAARKQKAPQNPSFVNQQVNVCELLKGAQPITVPYGLKALLAVGARSATDFLIGCVVATFGDGDAPLAIPLGLVDVTQAVPDESQCKNVSDRCNRICVAQ